mgnify:CR=1 FL=1
MGLIINGSLEVMRSKKGRTIYAPTKQLSSQSKNKPDKSNNNSNSYTHYFFRLPRGSNQTVFYSQRPDILDEKNLILRQFHKLILSDYFG